MADIQKRVTGCDDTCDGGGERGERGKRGPRGHDGATGPTGPTGSAGSGGGLLKFSGVVAAGGELSLQSFLADTGIGVGVVSISAPISYPVAVPRSLVNFSTNVLNTVVLLFGASLLLELLVNGAPVASITYGPGPATISGIQSVAFSPVPVAVGDTINVRATSLGIAVAVFVSATVGVQ